MAYGLIYQGEFSSIADNNYRLEILRKDYTGLFTTLPMSGVSVIQNWGTDEIKDGIKGCSLSINYLNFGSNPIEQFYSNNDDEFKVILYQGATVLFVGFLVQDDIREPMLDTTHEVQLSANDNLGLLKDIALNKYPVTVGAYSNPMTAEGHTIYITAPIQNFVYLRNCGPFVPVVGIPFILNFHTDPVMNTIFTPTVVTPLGSGNYNVRTNTFTGNTVAAPVSINGIGGAFDFYGRNTLLAVIAICLQNTGCNIQSYVYENLYEESQSPAKSSLDQTYIDIGSFISGETFESCYSVLDKICQRFNLTIFQSLGRWNIIRWDELRYGPINAFIYDKDFVLTGTDTLNSGLLFGFQQSIYPETGLTKSGLRPYEFVKETFNYQQPKYLLKNYDLQTVGALLRTYTSGLDTIKEHFATNWQGGWGAVFCDRFIRVVIDTASQTEKTRYMVLRRTLTSSDLPRSVAGTSIEVTKGDKIKFSFSTRTNWSVAPPILYVFALELYDGVTKRFVKDIPAGNGAWGGSIGFGQWEYSQNADQWQTFTIESSQTPFTGVVTPWLAFTIAGTPGNPSREVHYKDIRFEVIQYINESTKVIGHIHNDLQPVLIKNNEATEIYMDDSPRNSIAGTLFRKTYTGLVQDRTTLWQRTGFAEAKKLGEITTLEQLQWRSVIRTRLDGIFRGALNVSMLNHFTYAQLPGLNFLFGNLQIDYRNNKFTCSATELFKDGETDVNEDYTFTYIYDAK